jgi:HEXXH motif-containing protein
MDRAVRRRLVESVEAVLSTARTLGYSFDADFPGWADRVDSCERVPPQCWACYHDLVQAALRNDEIALARLAAELMAVDLEKVDGVHVLTVAPTDMSSAESERYIRIIDDNPDLALRLGPVRQSEVLRIRDLMMRARPLLFDDPDLLHEMDTLGHQVVLATSAPGVRQFGGAASIFLWGAVVLNPDLIPDRVTLCEALAHESAHALLFGFTLGADLTLNDPAERFPSPLRADLRPMEGIVHATFVLARMIYALEVLAQSESLTPDERALVQAKGERNLHHFQAGAEVVQAHARFTEDGATIFANCLLAMNVAQRNLRVGRA